MVAIGTSKMCHTHLDVGDDAPLTHGWVFRQLKLLGDDSVDAVHSQPPSEQVSSRILRHTAEIRTSCQRWIGAALGLLTHSDGDVHGVVDGFPIRANGHHSDPNRLSWAVVGFVRLNEGGEAFGVEVQLRLVGENLNLIHVTFDVENVRASVAGLILLDL